MHISKSKHDKQLSRTQSRQSKSLVIEDDNVMQSEPTGSSSSFAALAASAATQSSNFEEHSVENQSTTHADKDYSHRAYMRELKRVIDLSDVILMVLDARDPLGCRSSTIEREIRRRDGEGKKLVFVLNKIDLVPKSNVEDWLSFLRNHYPTVAFKASTQQQRQNLSQKKTTAGGSTSSSDCFGADALVNLLKNYTRNANLKTSIVCGIIGFPNVGKSSVVNSLKRSRACGVGATPGFTKVAQEVVLDKNIKILDSPGVVFADEDTNDKDAINDSEKLKKRQAEITLRNVIKVENIDDPQPSIELILERCSVNHLSQLYEIPEFNGVTDFLVKIALTRGRLGKGGVPDLLATARSVLRDYTCGKIPYYTQPPRSTMGAPVIQSKQSTLSSGFYPPSDAKPSENTSSAEGAAIVTEFSQAFDLASLLGESDAQTLSGAGTASFDTLKKRGREEEVPTKENNSDDVNMEAQSHPAGIVSLPPKKKTKQQAINDLDQQKKLFGSAEIDQFSQANPMSRQAQKKARKAEAKARLKSGALPMSGPGGEGELMKALNGLDVKMYDDSVQDDQGMQDSDDDEEEADEGYDGGRSGYGMSMFNVAPAPIPMAQPAAPPPQMIDEDEEL
ncbi:hypothetical protein E3Q23_02663 [Wallemia mellicola]|uniref:P-loop containing nucleoside triphosphate hydrolase protein n=1 Tax=Wallemia mellicola TaxID=1708541 RepID=A0A4T0T3Z5_9BASI|nr:hypothetical protein E3Q23_02663 [Wallemia mellicola]TIB94376.1 P-loop containing nucleoside triphosphate hydrolase protein [Wallemia mellicola]TIC04283.1 P-loop containing nucleoside triphosphate hydrolase protein [Wallemia mellicola]TIC11083.1 P-loop containing nucleoside triphosphate hydrolase protein [Wallemia mellicola]TIC12035.1 P-loop containing nucleoside triphosphate hydrolase protein [Wallemia mellicola]